MVWRRKKDTKISQVVKDVPSVAHGSTVAAVAGGHSATPIEERDQRGVENSDRLASVPAAVATFEFTSSALDGTKRPYVIPRGYSVRGNLVSDRPVEIEGEYGSGCLKAQQVTVAPSGALLGEVEVDVLRVAGRVPAKVSARGVVEVVSQGELSGAIKAPQIRVAAGARIHLAELKIGR